MRDIVSNIGVVTAIAPAVLTATATGATLDLLGFGSAAFVITTGAIVGGGDFTTKVQVSDDGTAFEDWEPGFLTPELPVALEADAIVKVGYLGFKRYVRLVVTKVGGTSIAASAVLVKGHAAERPVI